MALWLHHVTYIDFRGQRPQLNAGLRGKGPCGPMSSMLSASPAIDLRESGAREKKLGTFRVRTLSIRCTAV